jgi:exopolysaccharide production protein ExoY
MASQPHCYDQLAYELTRVEEGAVSLPLLSGFERMVAGAGLLVCLPLLFVACFVAWLLSGRSPLIAHRRVGKDGRQMWVYKVRTMWESRPPKRRPFSLVEFLRGSIVPECKCRFDPRITSRFALFCRKYSIDELPQLWSVVAGKMSMVGPRPMTDLELKKYYGSDMRRILQFKPGLTGLWQIHGRSKLNYRQRRRLDLFMVDKWSFRLYMCILLSSVPKVLMGKDAW